MNVCLQQLLHTNMNKLAAFFTAILLCTAALSAKPILQNMDTTNLKNTDTVTFGAGCFWCVEAVFQQLKGVEKVRSGYMGGKIGNPTYREVCSGLTGHAEVCEVTYNPSIISFAELLEVFWKTHDPTTLNKQGADAGTQYRSVIFYHSEKQKEEAAFYKKKIDESGFFKDKIVTEITPRAVFYVAEDYHQNYFNENGSEPYCRVVIQPKVDKLRAIFNDKLK